MDIDIIEMEINEQTLVRVKISFENEEDILQSSEDYIKKYKEEHMYKSSNELRKKEYERFINFYELAESLNGIIKERSIYFLKDKNYRTYFVEFKEYAKAKQFSEIFFGLYPECEEKEGIFEMV